MPVTIPRYQRQVAVQGATSAVQASPESFGAAVPRATQVMSQGLGVASNELMAAHGRVRNREHTAMRISEGSEASRRFTEEYRKRSTEGGFKSQTDVMDTMSWLDSEISKTVEKHQGSPESKMALQERLQQQRDKIVDAAAFEAMETQKAVARSDADERMAGIQQGIINDPTSINDAFDQADRIADDVADAFTPAETIAMQDRYRQQIAISAIEGYMARGAYDEAANLMQQPGVVESMTPDQQLSISGRLQDAKTQRQQSLFETQGKLESAALALGVPVEQLPMWARVQAVGLTPPTAPKQDPYKAQTDAGKVEQDRQHFINTYGADSPQAMAFEEAVSADQAGTPPDLSEVRGMRQEFTKLSGNFTESLDAYNRIKAVGEGDGTPAGDMAVIFGYMKMLDPTSTVREGEYATASNAANWSDRMKAIYNKIVDGTTLTPTMRQDFLSRAEDVFGAKLASHQALEAQFSGLAERAGYDPKDVVIDFKTPKKGTNTATAPGQQPEPGTAPEQQNVFTYGMDGKPIGQVPPEADAPIVDDDTPTPIDMDEIQRFGADKPDFKERAGKMADLLESGEATDLQDAYEKAGLSAPKQAKTKRPSLKDGA